MLELDQVSFAGLIGYLKKKKKALCWYCFSVFIRQNAGLQQERKLGRLHPISSTTCGKINIFWLLQKSFWENATLSKYRITVSLAWPYSFWAPASNYWFCKLTEVKKHSLSVPFCSTSLSLLDLLVITHIPTGRVRWPSDFLPDRCYRIPSPSKLLDGELQEDCVILRQKANCCWGWHPSATVWASSQSAPFL